ncbi:MAG: sulfurtransferase TusA family protein [Bacteroidia bacterium]|nr:sulfurtransferase TusA family protein [Bacteroidia bacterium]
MPIVKLALKIKQLKVGDIIEITATDPAFKPDLEAWIRKTGHELLQFDNQKVKTALIRKICEN